MNQFDKKQLLYFHPKDEETIKKALNDYKELLDTDRAVVNQVFDIEFKIQENTEVRRVQVKDTKNQDLVKRALSMGPDGGDTYYPDYIGDTDEIYISEVLFFAIALEYPNLKETIVETAKSIVAHSRRCNDTWELWIDSMRIFGIEVLYMLAYTDVNKAYLLSQFLIPYWDTEHAVSYEGYLRDLLIKNGWSRPMIKAFVWCDNDSFRQSIAYSEETTLGNYLKNNLEEYEYFKNEVQGRFSKQPMLAYNDRISEEENPILELYFSLVIHAEEYGPLIEDTESILQEFFINDTLENEAFDLAKVLKSNNIKPLRVLSDRVAKEQNESASVDEYYDDYERGDGLESFRELILHLPEGPKLWEYIVRGKYVDALHDLPETPLIPLAKEYSSKAYIQIKYYTGRDRNENELREEIESVISDVTVELLSLEEEEAVILYERKLLPLNEEINNMQQERNQIYLRFIDVLYRAFGKKPLPSDLKNVIVLNDPLLSLDEYNRRYTEQLDEDASEEAKEIYEKNIVIDILNHFLDYETNLEKESFDDLNYVFAKRRSRYDCSWWPSDKIGCYTAATYLLFKDFEKRIGDSYTEKLFMYINSGVWGIIADVLDRNFVANKDLVDKDLLSVKENVIEYITEKDCTVTEDDAYEFFQKILIKTDSDIGGSKYRLFDKYKYKSQRITLLLYWLSQMPLPSQVLAKRIWKLWVRLDPQRVIEHLASSVTGYSYRCTFENLLDETEFYDRIEKMGIPKSQSLVFQMDLALEKYYNYRYDEDKLNYLRWLEKYEAIDSTPEGMLDTIDKNNALALDEGLHYISSYNRIEFFTDLSLYSKRFPFHQPELFRETLTTILENNLEPWYKRLEVYDDSNAILLRNYSKKDDPTLQRYLNMPIQLDPKAMSKMKWDVDYSKTEVQILREENDQLFLVYPKEPVESSNNESNTNLVKPIQLSWGKVLIFKDNVSIDLIINNIENAIKNSDVATLIFDKIQDYLNDTLSYDEIKIIFDKCIQKQFFEIRGKYEVSANIQQFIWMLPEKQRNSLIKLFANHSKNSTDIFTTHIKKHYLKMQIKEGALDFNSFPDAYDDDIYTEKAYKFLISLLETLEVNRLYILYLVLDLDIEYSLEWLLRIDSMELFQLSQQLSVKHRLKLVELLQQTEKTKVKLDVFLNDSSRRVRDKLDAD